MPSDLTTALRSLGGDSYGQHRRVMLEAADKIDRLQAFVDSFGVCTCEEGMCDPVHDFQCRAREALTGVNNAPKKRNA